MAKQTINLKLRSLKYSAVAPFTTDDVAEDGVAGHTAGNTFNSDPDNPNTGTFYMQTPSARGGAAIQLGMAEVPGSEYWEPWGATITQNHPWVDDSLDGSTITLSSGILTIAQIYAAQWTSQSSLKTTASEAANIIRIIGSLASNLVDIDDAVFISIASTGGNASLYFAAGPGNSYWMWPPNYLIGASVLDGRDILLSDYGISGTISQVQLNINLFGIESTATINYDSIDFL